MSIDEPIELLISAFSNSLLKYIYGNVSITGSPRVNEIIPLFQEFQATENVRVLTIAVFKTI